MKAFLFTIFLLLGSAGAASGCSCSQTYPLDREFAGAENVVIMKLTAVTKADGTEEYSFMNNVRQSTLQVVKVFKGKLKVGRELPFAQGGGADCVWAFSEEEIGDEYLLFLSGGKGLRGVSVCSRSSPVTSAAADIRYFENIANLRRRTRLYGTLEQEFKSPVVNAEKDFRHEPLKDKTVRITGRGRDIRVKTDAEGFYEVYGLPPGRYRVEPERVKGFRFENENDEKVLAGKKGVLFGTYYPSKWDFEGCPGGFDAVKTKAGILGYFETASKNIDASGNITGIELKLQVSICKKEK